MVLSEVERDVSTAIAERRDDLVELATALIGFDTTAREVGDPARDEVALQEHLARRLAAAGADIDLWEPSLAELGGRALVPVGLDFEGRPQLLARFRGSGSGRSLLFNGHIDVVSAEPRDRWATDPYRAETRDGRLYGRGACDMKGGVAAMIVAAETLAGMGIRLDGDLLVSTNTDEESSGAGGMALVAHGVRADGGIVPEPTRFDVWIACRGSSFLTIDVAGQPGHAEMPQPHWREGGAVNAIEKATLVLEELQLLRKDWRERGEFRHAYLSPGDVVPTVIAGGEWGSTYPASCRIRCVVPYAPSQADPDGWTSLLELEVGERIARVCAADDWLAENPPSITWSAGVLPMEIAEDDPIVKTVLRVSADLGRPGSAVGLDSWFDGATFTRFGATPTVAFGPSGLDGKRTVAHTVDEFVPIEDLVACAQSLAISAIRFCGTAA